MKNFVVLTGSGISSESGLKTFREAGGLWEGYNVYDVATPEAWHRDRKLVLEFYNERRKQALKAEPNEGHKALKALEDYFDVTVITQNVDNLHEKAGSSKVIHLHGELFKSRSTTDPDLIYDIEGWELKEGDKCEKGSQLRPHVVWFGEMVPMMEKAAHITSKADILLVVGTSLVVYPAAGLVNYVRNDVPIFVVDPNIPQVYSSNPIFNYEEPASTGVSKVLEKLKADYL
jgi:NAD-dependent deacetylase